MKWRVYGPLGSFLSPICRLSPLAWLTIAPLCQSSQVSISSPDSCSGLRPYRDNGNFYISTYMSKRHLKLKVARAELKAVRQMELSFVSPLSSIPPAHIPAWPTYEQFLMTLTSNVSWSHLSPSNPVPRPLHWWMWQPQTGLFPH